MDDVILLSINPTVDTKVEARICDTLVTPIVVLFKNSTSDSMPHDDLSWLHGGGLVEKDLPYLSSQVFFSHMT